MSSRRPSPSPRSRAKSATVAAVSLLAALTLGVLPSLPAFGQNAKIQAEAKKLQSEAMDVEFLSLEFKKAKTKLQDALKKCQGKDKGGALNCDKSMLASLHRDLGIVLINMKDNTNGDAEFYEAFQADVNVTIAKDYLDNPDVKKLWEGAKKGASPPSTTSVPTSPTTPPTSTAKGAVSLNVSQAPTGYQLPLVVDAPDGADSVKVFYKTSTMEKYTAVEAKRQGGKYVVALGCEHTQFAGEIKVYVRVYDAEKNEVEHLGSLKEPVVVKLVEKLPADVEPPRFPGDKEPEKCVEKNDCPPGLPCSKKKPEGSGCESDDECETDLSCVNNDNGTKWCHDTGGKPKPSGDGKMPRFFIGLHGTGDLLFIGGENDICNQTAWACYKDGLEYGGAESTVLTGGNKVAVVNGAAGSTNGGPALATFRILASFDYLVNGYISLGLRAGYALHGNPTTKAKFLPIHAEGRIQIFPIPIDEKVSGARPYLTAGGGVGEFDAAVPNVIAGTPDGPGAEDCSVPGGKCTNGISAYRLAGLGFAAVGGGMWLFVNGRTAINFGVRALFPIPTFSLGVSMEFGVVTGF